MEKPVFQLLVSSIELIKNPVAWFSKKNWLVRLAFAVILIPIISGVAIQSHERYQKRNESGSTNEQIASLSDKLTQLQTSLSALEAAQAEHSEQAQPPRTVGTASTSGEATPATLGESTESLVFYIPADTASVAAFVAPSLTAKQATYYEGGQLLFIEEEKSGWVAVIDETNGTVWVQADVGIQLIWP